MSGELKRLLSEETGRTGRNLNDVAVGILAARFAVPFEPSGRPGKRPGHGSAVLLRMPAELKRKLDARAAQRRRNVNDLIVETLTQRLGKDDGSYQRFVERPHSRRGQGAWRSSASATAPTRCCRASSTTGTRRRRVRPG
jgi:hypothetical protein